jgi:hypothetical protein
MISDSAGPAAKNKVKSNVNNKAKGKIQTFVTGEAGPASTDASAKVAISR